MQSPSFYEHSSPCGVGTGGPFSFTRTKVIIALGLYSVQNPNASLHSLSCFQNAKHVSYVHTCMHVACMCSNALECIRKMEAEDKLYANDDSNSNSKPKSNIKSKPESEFTDCIVRCIDRAASGGPSSGRDCIWGPVIRTGCIWGPVIRTGCLWGPAIRTGCIWTGCIWGPVIRTGCIWGPVIRTGCIWGPAIRNSGIFPPPIRSPLSH
jgi:hypothetical protein